MYILSRKRIESQNGHNKEQIEISEVCNIGIKKVCTQKPGTLHPKQVKSM